MSLKKSRKRKLGNEMEEVKEDSVHDFFSIFMEKSLEDIQKNTLRQPKKLREHAKKELPGIGTALEVKGINSQGVNELSPVNLGWNPSLVSNFNKIHEKLESENQGYFDIINRYSDLLTYPSSKDYRDMYMAHILHHLVKTRNLVIGNKQKMQNAIEKETVTDELIESLRDQGFVRPTVLILCPFKKDAYDIVERLKYLIYGDSKPDIMKGARFESEFSSPGEAPEFSSTIDEETRELLTGNNDDCFRVGIAISKKTLKLFENFERSDILLCSPLGLRMILEKEVDESHFLSSLNITVIDGADIMLQQNWQNITLIFEKMLQQPAKIITDISKVRQHYLDGDSKFYHQLLMFSRYPHELFSALIYGESFNHQGLVVTQPPQEGTLDNVLIPLSQELHRFEIPPSTDQSDARFEYFKSHVVQFLKLHTCLVIPSYYDFVRVRNHLKRLEESFVALHEYADEKLVKRAKDMFYHERKSVLIVTERYYYFNRKKIRGIDQLIFYQLPSHPKFYSEFLNMARIHEGRRLKSILLYANTVDRIRIENTFGKEMAVGMLSDERRSVQVLLSE